MSFSDGLHMRWRETAPDRGVLKFAIGELERLHATWPETVQCNIVIERAPSAAESAPRIRALVELELGRRMENVQARAIGDDPYAALRRAFGDLFRCMPAPAEQPVSFGRDVAA